MQTAKDQAKQILDQLPDSATLGDIRHELNDSLYTLQVKQQIELGMKDSRDGRITPHAEVKKHFLHDRR